MTNKGLLEYLARKSADLSTRLREDAQIMKDVPGFPTIAAELEEAASAVETIERAKRAFDTLTRAIEAEGYSVFVDLDGNYSVEAKDTDTTPDVPELLPEIDRSPSPYWKNHVTGEQDND